MPLKIRGFLTILDIPDLRCLILTGRDDAFAIRGESGRSDNIIMSFQGVDYLSRLGVPDLRCFVKAPCDDALAIRGESGSSDISVMSLQGDGLPVRSGHPRPSP